MRELERLDLLLPELVDDRLDLGLVLLDRLALAHQVGVLLLGLLEHGEHLLVDALAQIVELRLLLCVLRLDGARLAFREVVLAVLLAEGALLSLNPRVALDELTARALGLLELLVRAALPVLELLELELRVAAALDGLVALRLEGGDLLVEGVEGAPPLRERRHRAVVLLLLGELLGLLGGEPCALRLVALRELGELLLERLPLRGELLALEGEPLLCLLLRLQRLLLRLELLLRRLERALGLCEPLLAVALKVAQLRRETLLERRRVGERLLSRRDRLARLTPLRLERLEVARKLVRLGLQEDSNGTCDTWGKEWASVCVCVCVCACV